MKTRILVRDDRCRQLGSRVAGADPGTTEGAVVCLSDRGGPHVDRACTYKLRKRKAGNVYAVKVWGGLYRRETAVSLGLEDPVADVHSVELDSLPAVLDLALGVDLVRRSGLVVEGVALHGKKTGTLALAESAGMAVAVGAIRHGLGPGQIERPHKMRWFPDVLGLAGNTPDKLAKKCVLAAVKGERVVGRPSIVRWDVPIPEEVLDEHVADALGLALWGMGYRLTGTA